MDLQDWCKVCGYIRRERAGLLADLEYHARNMAGEIEAGRDGDGWVFVRAAKIAAAADALSCLRSLADAHLQMPVHKLEGVSDEQPF